MIALIIIFLLIALWGGNRLFWHERTLTNAERFAHGDPPKATGNE